MRLKTVKEREMLSPKQLDAVIDLATFGSNTISAHQRGRNYNTLKNTLSNIYDKVEEYSGTRPTQANALIYFIFGRFLEDAEVRHLIESGELYNWKLNHSEEE